MELDLNPIDVRTVLEAAILGVREAALRAELTMHIAVADDAKKFVADEARVREYSVFAVEDEGRFPGWVAHLLSQHG